MLVRASGQIIPGVFLLSLGRSCHYAITHEIESGRPLSQQTFSLFDPGSSAHIPGLIERLKSVGLNPGNLSRIFLTHAHAERIGGLALLKEMFPNATVTASSGTQTLFKDAQAAKLLNEDDANISTLLTELGSKELEARPDAILTGMLDRVATDGEAIALSANVSIHATNLSGHSPGALGYLVYPQGLLVCDESLGYYNGKNLAAPGGDIGLETALQTINKIIHLDLAGILLPFQGALTGNLQRKHLQAVIENTADLLNESKQAAAAGVPEADIQKAIFESFYAFDEGDPVLRYALDRSLNAVWKQVISILVQEKRA